MKLMIGLGLMPLMLVLSLSDALAEDKEPVLLDEPGVAVGPAAAPGNKVPTPATKGDKKAKAGELTLPKALEKIWSTTYLSTKWYLGYTYGAEGKKNEIGEYIEKTINKFFISRGYLTLKLKPFSWFEPRVTLDAYLAAAGGFKVRLKYLYAKFKLPIETVVVTEPYIKLGMVQTPWIGYETSINSYRMEGKMFLDRSKVTNSADLGATAGVLLGRKLAKSYRDSVSSKNPGTWGSIALGIYNGGGYSSKEMNGNKVFQSRISLRPAGPWLPNLQLTHFLIYGEGNKEDGPLWLVNHFMASFEQRYFVLTGQVGLGEGNQKGDKVDPASGESVDFLGYAFFGALKLPWIHSSVIARVDRFDWDTAGGSPATTRVIAGYAVHFAKKNFVLLSMDRLAYDDGVQPTDWQFKITLQAAYPTKR